MLGWIGYSWICKDKNVYYYINTSFLHTVPFSSRCPTTSSSDSSTTSKDVDPSVPSRNEDCQIEVDSSVNGCHKDNGSVSAAAATLNRSISNGKKDELEEEELGIGKNISIKQVQHQQHEQKDTTG